MARAASRVQLYDRPLPAAPEAERALLGALLCGGADPALVAAELSDTDLSLEAHRRIYRAVLELYEAGIEVNYVTVAERLRAAGHLESVGGLSYLTELERGSVPVSVESYLRLLRDRSLARRTIMTCQSVIDRCYQADPPQEVLQTAERLLAELGASASVDRDTLTPYQVIERTAGSIDALVCAPPARMLTTPWPALNTLLGGISPGQLVVLAARPGIGKTAAACQIADRAASGGAGVLFITLEMSAEEIVRRMASMRAGIDLHQWRAGRLEVAEQRALYAAVNEICELPIRLCDRATVTAAAIAAAVRRERARGSVELVVIDYLQLLRGVERYASRVEEITHITRSLKLVARELEVGVLLLSQLNRAPEVERRRPTLSDLRDSGSIEQDADVVVFLHEDRESSSAAMNGQPRQVEVIVAKQRNGPRGKVFLQFNPRFIRFEEVLREQR